VGGYKRGLLIMSVTMQNIGTEFGDEPNFVLCSFTYKYSRLAIRNTQGVWEVKVYLVEKVYLKINVCLAGGPIVSYPQSCRGLNPTETTEVLS
jgi:hypothetical protein